MLGAGVCLSCALEQQDIQLSLNLSVYLQSKAPHFLLLSFHDWLLHQCHPLPPLVTSFGEDGVQWGHPDPAVPFGL